MIKNLTIIIVIFCFGALQAQENPRSRFYIRSASELIFSLGDVTIDSGSVDPVLRFSGFFHLQEQLHYDFNKTFGSYTGLGIRNVGMINKINDSVKIKQRVYALAIPIALKIGSLPKGFNMAIGAEGEFFFHYKQKVFYDDNKTKKSEWLSDKVNIFNPSVFLEVHSPKGSYLRVKYYLLDFLKEHNQQVKINGHSYDYEPKSSKLFYVAIGTTIRQKSKQRRSNELPPPAINSAAVF